MIKRSCTLSQTSQRHSREHLIIGAEQKSKDGYELRFAVNYLAPFLLTHLLLPCLRQAPPARILNVASVGQAPLDFSNLMLERHYDPADAYRQSKAAIRQASRALTAIPGECSVSGSGSIGAFWRGTMVSPHASRCKTWRKSWSAWAI
ncbi:MAG TPA: hypothetical protein VFV38_16780 [Ktedonobacteraceae bacterium]|nr:hypothetical protein [Ktedonobacteraceae bacterium]